jgi:hypothetical protein
MVYTATMLHYGSTDEGNERKGTDQMSRDTTRELQKVVKCINAKCELNQMVPKRRF